MKSLRDKNKKFYLECDCGCGILELERWYWDDKEDWNNIALTYYIRASDVKWLVSWKNKLKLIWSIIKGRDHFLYDISINEDNFDNFKEFVNSI